MHKVSVVIPTYNAAGHLKEALDSVLAQTYPVFELIIVDDGSTDGTADLVKQYTESQSHKVTRSQNETPGSQGHQVTTAHKNGVTKSQVTVKYIYQENKGPATARNRGIQETQGEYIAFLDSDDLWLADKLEKQMALFENTSYALVYCDMSHMVNNTLKLHSLLKEARYKQVASGRIFRNLLQENFIFTPTVILRKEILEHIGLFDESYKICEDYKMWLNIARKYEIGFVDAPLVIRRRHTSNLTINKTAFNQCGIRLFTELYQQNHKDKTARKLIRNELSKRYFNLGYYYWHRRENKEARCNFCMSLRYRARILKVSPYLVSSYLPDACISFLRRLKNA